jgi:hypothetical protein
MGQDREISDALMIARKRRASGGKALSYPIAPKSEWYGDSNYESTGGKMEHMHPDNFLKTVRPLTMDDTARENINDLKQHIQKGRSLDPLAIYPNGKEDGRHRAHAAKELGIKSVPVLMWPRPARAHGGGVKSQFHVGPIHSGVAGRTDHLPLTVPSGSYVLPADIVSAHGEGSTIAGFKVLRRMFGGNPYGGHGMPYGATGGPYGEPMPHKAAGGETSGVPIVAAGGEYVLSPNQVMFAGNGDLEAGHRALDGFVKQSRAELVKTLSNLPGPKKN